jgi:hypothetical protein
VLMSLAAWPAVTHAQGNLVIEGGWHDFGQLPMGTSASATLDVWNDGAEALTLGNIGFDGEAGPFTLGTGGCVTGLVLAAGESCDLSVGFAAPQTHGEHDALVLVQDETGTEVASALLSGSTLMPVLTPVPGYLSADPQSLDFGFMPIGMTSSSQAVTIRNAGDTPVTFATTLGRRVRGPSAPDFTLMADQCVGTLSPGATCGLSVAFSPISRSRVGPSGAREAHAELYLRRDGAPARSRVLAVSIALKGVAPVTAPLPIAPTVDYGELEEDLVRLAEGVPRLLRGGQRQGRRLLAFKAPAAGRLSLQVRALRPARRMRLATGSIRLETAATGRLRFVLGPKARKLLRLPRKTRVKVIVAFKVRATGETFKQALELNVRRPCTAAPCTKSVRSLGG